jgi:hypothetical protein
MKYILLFVSNRDDDEAFAKLPEAEKVKIYGPIMKWFEDNGKAGKVIGGEELQGIETASTVRYTNGKAVVTDGPYIESKEVFGGYALIEVKNMEEAIELAKTWPGKSIVEVRPLVDHSSVPAQAAH